MGYLSRAERDAMQADSAAALHMLADRWRISGSGRRTLYLANEKVSIFPGGNKDITDSATGVVGAKETYVGAVNLDSDVTENDQYRNVRDRATGDAYMTGVRFTVSTAAVHPTVIQLRLHEEGT
jgi:hypothetical protein